MKILVIADLHGNVEVLDKLDEAFREADIVLMAGDFADAIKKLPGDPVLKKLCEKHNEIYAVRGNHDTEDFEDALEDAGINCECTINHTQGILIVGSFGATPFSHDTPLEREEDEIMSDFSILEAGELEGRPLHSLIILSHNPPFGCKADSVTDTVHAGSKAFRALIERVEPLLVVTGHIHEGTGLDKIGRTTVINSGALGLNGTYAFVETEGEGDEITIKSAEIKKI